MKTILTALLLSIAATSVGAEEITVTITVKFDQAWVQHLVENKDKIIAQQEAMVKRFQADAEQSETEWNELMDVLNQL